MLYAQMRAAIEAAAVDRLTELNQALYAAYGPGAGGLDDDELVQLSELLEARRNPGTAARPRLEGVAVAEPVMPACARRLSRSGSRPRTSESKTRRRRWEGAGYMPPVIHAAFTEAERAVLAVVASEIGKRGSCTLANGHVAAVAGVCISVVKRALRQARALGLVTVEERRRSRRRNDTNVVRIISREWASWLRRRLPRGNHAGLGGGVPAVPTTNVGYFSKRVKGRNRSCATGTNGLPYTAASPVRAEGA